MSVSVVTPPAAIVSADEARKRLGLDASDDVLNPLIAAATAMLDAPDGWLRIAIGTQTLEIVRGASEDAAPLPYPPILEVLTRTPSADGLTVKTRYRAGYANVPENLKYAVLLQARHLHAIGTRDLFLSQRTVEGAGSRSWVVSEVSSKLIANAVQSLVGHMRVPRV